ncbi:MAG: FAD-dependent oxidoreductase, partial [Chloroflexi bacterium]|nr:FAD-dependent oxidoreductase [Chloroflexota bacterium]
MSTYVIVGGVAGGATAAARLRRMDEQAQIILLERGPYVSFANCGLPYHIGEVIQDREALLVSTPEKLAAEFAIDVRTEQEAIAIDRAARQVVVRDLRTAETYRLDYDKLILSPGARSVVPPVPGVDAPGVYTLRSIPDMDAIKARVDAGDVQQAVIVGGGFIGLEMAENLSHRGVAVTVVEMAPQVMTAFDFEIAAMLHRHLREKGVRLALGDGLQQIEERAPGQLTVTLASGNQIPADLVILAIGVRPESELAARADLPLGPRGHILVNEHMQTADPDIYAVGDAIQVIHPITGAATAIPLAGPANRQARIAADHITGKDSAYRGTMGTSIVKVFDLTAACTGTNSQTLEKQGIPFLSSITHSNDHVGYYPGATPQTIKLLYAPDDGKLLGAQVVGYNAVDRSIDALAVAVQAGMTVYDLEHLELAYAPPYGAAKDAVNIAGFVAANQLRGDTDLVQVQDLPRLLESPDVGILDVRTDAEWQIGHIPNAVHIPNTQLRARLNELSQDKRWVVYCAIGRRAYVMERMLKQHGYRAMNLSGGYNTYRVVTEPQSNIGQPPADDEAPIAIQLPQAANTPQKEIVAMIESETPALELNACGLQCPGPIMAVYKKMQEMQPGQTLRVVATDPGFKRDVAAWAERTGNTLLEVGQTNGHITALLRKGSTQPQVTVQEGGVLPNAKTMVVFSGDLDHALASFVIANGAAAMGKQVTMFFTFWGLNILRR